VAVLTAPGIVPAEVVGDGTASSCNEPALDAALNGGGNVTFNCGPSIKMDTHIRGPEGQMDTP
jgi:hypothetical protein